MAEDVVGMADAGFSARGSDRLTRPLVSGFRVMATAGTPLTTAAAIRVLNRGVMPSMPVWQRQWQRQWWNRRRPIRCPRRLWA